MIIDFNNSCIRSRILRGFNKTEINDFYKSFTKVKNKNYVPEPYVRKMHSLLEDLGYSLKILLDMVIKYFNHKI